MTDETDFAMCIVSSAKVDRRAEYYGRRADLHMFFSGNREWATMQLSFFFRLSKQFIPSTSLENHT